MWLVGCDLLTTFFVSALFDGMFIVALTELMSSLNALTAAWAITAWTALLVFQIAMIIILVKCRTDTRERLSNLFSSTLISAARLSLLSKIVLVELTVMATLVAVTAIWSAPNNYDSLCYHLPRIVHWIADQSLKNYPTSILRQLTSSVGAEFAICQNMLLSGDDYGANLIQCFAYLGSMVGAIGVSRLLKFSTESQLLTGLCVASIPMAILQGSSTQNDLLTSFWLLAFFYFALQLTGSRSATMLKCVTLATCCGAALGLACITKGTAYFIALPAMVYVAWKLFVSLKQRAVIPLGIIGAVTLITNLGYFLRNIGTFGAPLDPFNSGKYGTSVVTTDFNVLALFSIFWRNLSLQFQTSVSSANSIVEHLILKLLAVLHISPGDTATSFAGLKYAMSGYTTSDDFAGSPVHVALICLFLAGLLWKSKKLNHLTAYTTIICFSSLLLMSLLKWQPWNARLELPLIILFCPLMVAAIKRLPGPVWSYCVSLLLFYMAWPCLVTNSSRPLQGPNSVIRQSHYATYFMGNHQQRMSFDAGVKQLLPVRPAVVGLITSRDSAEYLLSAALAHAGLAKVHIVQVCVENATNKIHSELSASNNTNINSTIDSDTKPESKPEYVFGISPDESQVKELLSRGYHYVFKADNQSENLQLFALTGSSRS
jgi:hypothetical protein